MHADPAVHVGGARLRAAEDVEVGQAGERPDRLQGNLDPGGWSGVIPPAWVLHALVVVGFRLLHEQKDLTTSYDCFVVVVVV